VTSTSQSVINIPCNYMYIHTYSASLPQSPISGHLQCTVYMHGMSSVSSPPLSEGLGRATSRPPNPTRRRGTYRAAYARCRILWDWIGWLGGLHMSRAWCGLGPPVLCVCVCVSVCIHAGQGMVMVWYGMALSGVKVS
jgi:hypothetical protein